jgi:hypothetical protein
MQLHLMSTTCLNDVDVDRHLDRDAPSLHPDHDVYYHHYYHQYYYHYYHHYHATLPPVAAAAAAVSRRSQLDQLESKTLLEMKKKKN